MPSTRLSPIRVLVVGDHALFRRGLENVLSGEPDIEVAGEAGDGLGVVERCVQLEPDLVLMDVRMPGASGIADGLSNRDIATELFIAEKHREGPRTQHPREAAPPLPDGSRGVRHAGEAPRRGVTWPSRSLAHLGAPTPELRGRAAPGSAEPEPCRDGRRRPPRR